MRSATAFFPPCMMTFMNLARSTLPNLGSGRISRLGTSRRRGISVHLSICFSWLSKAPGSQSASRLLDPGLGHFARLPCLRHPSTEKLQNDLSLLRALRAVLRAGLLAILDALE